MSKASTQQVSQRFEDFSIFKDFFSRLVIQIEPPFPEIRKNSIFIEIFL